VMSGPLGWLMGDDQARDAGPPETGL